jgi:hypothetical protein
MVEKRDRSTSDTAQTRRTGQTFDASQAGDGRLSAAHFEDGYERISVRLREIDGVGEPLHCSLSDTMSSGTKLWLLGH